MHLGHKHHDGDGVNHHDHEKIVEVTSVPQRFEADVLVQSLKAGGIDAMVGGDPGAAYKSTIAAALGGYQILVFENDVDAAREIIAGIELAEQ